MSALGGLTSQSGAGRLLLALSVTVCIGSWGCGNSETFLQDEAVAGPVAAKDLNSDPDIVEIALSAGVDQKAYENGQYTEVWTYNGNVPGPLIEAKVGDRLLVHFRNDLPESTTIHWHGIRLPSAMDGTLAMQRPIKPGEDFDYEFTLKDAGFFWFHPHVRSDIQVQKGLYGVLRVRGPNEPAANDEQILVLDDIRLREDGAIAEYLDDQSIMMGSEGNTLLVNGVNRAELKFQAGGTTRLRLVNVANGRFFNLRLPGHSFRVIGTDGGLIPEPYDVQRLLIAPGERYDVMVSLDAAFAGKRLRLMNDAYERGHHTGDAAPMELARVTVVQSPDTFAHVLPTAFPSIEQLPATEPTFRVELDEGSNADGLIFTVNGKAYPDVPMIEIAKGELRAFDVINQSEMDHPFHLHGFFFQVLERNGSTEDIGGLANKDTIIVPAESSLRLGALFDASGHWMYHCHILEHAEFGMMGEIHVE